MLIQISFYWRNRYWYSCYSESHTGTDVSGSNLFYIKVYGSNANINYTLYYYNYANHKVYLFQSFTLNIHIIHEYGYFFFPF